MTEPLKAAAVQAKHAATIAALEAFDASFQELLLMTPQAEPAVEGKPSRRLFTPDMIDSAREVARGMKVMRFDVLSVAQGVMDYTEEAREAALKAQQGKFRMVDADAPTPAAEVPNA